MPTTTYLMVPVPEGSSLPEDILEWCRECNPETGGDFYDIDHSFEGIYDGATEVLTYDAISGEVTRHPINGTPDAAPARRRISPPIDFPVREVAPGPHTTTCGVCCRSWDDTVSTAYTPAPAGRCPFEQFHGEPVDAEVVVWTGEEATCVETTYTLWELAMGAVDHDVSPYSPADVFAYIADSFFADEISRGDFMREDLEEVLAPGTSTLDTVRLFMLRGN